MKPVARDASARRLPPCAAALCVCCLLVSPARAQTGEPAAPPNGDGAPAADAATPAPGADASASRSASQVPAPPASPPSAAAVNAAVAPLVVRIVVGDASGRGVFFGPPNHVLTAYRLVNRKGTLEVILANGTRTTARVVGWNRASGLALLELDQAPRVAVIPLAARAPEIGDAVLSPDLVPTGPPQEGAVPVAPVLSSGRVSGRLDDTLWVDLPLGVGDLGRPVLTLEGALLGIVVGDASGASPEESYLPRLASRARVAGGAALMALLREPLTAGAFEPESLSEWSSIRGFIVVPLASNGIQGAALQFGYRYDWFVFLVREGFAMTGFAPKGGPHYERVNNRFFFELELEIQFKVFSQSALWLGAGGVYLADSITRRELDADGGVADAKRSDRRVRPLFGVGLNDGAIEFGIQGYHDHGLAGRVGLGFVWGR